MTFYKGPKRAEIEFEDDTFVDKTIQRAVDDVFAFSSPAVTKPKAMFLAGDPVSNKDAIITALKKDNPGCVVVNMARLKEYHPRFDILVKKNYYIANSQLEPFAKEIADQIIDRAILENVSIIFDGTFVGSYDDMNNAMNTMKEAGYSNELNALSLNETYSIIRAGYNNEMNIKYKQQQILADPETYRELYQAIPKNIDKAIQQNLIDSCKLYSSHIERKETVHINDYSQKELPEFQSDYKYHQAKDLTQGDVMVMGQIESKTIDMMSVREAPMEEIQAFKKLIAEAKGSISITNETISEKSALAAEPLILYNVKAAIVTIEDQVIDHIKNQNFAAILEIEKFNADEKFVERVVNLDIPDASKIAGLTLLQVDNAAAVVHESKTQNILNSNNNPVQTQQKENGKDKGMELKLE